MGAGIRFDRKGINAITELQMRAKGMANGFLRFNTSNFNRETPYLLR
jgi:hypothetical protein